jgi:hypothetical protein
VDDGKLTNLNREKGLIRYNEITDKMINLIKIEPEISSMNPLDKEEIEFYYKNKKETIDPLTIDPLTIDDFIFGLTCFKILEDGEFYTIHKNENINDLIIETLMELYIGDDQEEKYNLLSRFIKTYDFAQKVLILRNDLEIPSSIINNFLDILRYDDKLENETMLLNFDYKILIDQAMIDTFAEMIHHSTNLKTLAIIISNTGDENEVNLDNLANIFKAIEKNVKIKAFAVIPSQLSRHTLSEANQKIFVNILKKNQSLLLCAIPGLLLTDEKFNSLMQIMKNHKSLQGVVIDNEKYEEERLCCFIDMVNKNSRIKVAGF